MTKPNVFIIEALCDDPIDSSYNASDLCQTLSIHSSLKLAIAQCKVYATEKPKCFDMASEDWLFAILECEQDSKDPCLSIKCVMKLDSNGEPYDYGKLYGKLMTVANTKENTNDH